MGGGFAQLWKAETDLFIWLSTTPRSRPISGAARGTSSTTNQPFRYLSSWVKAFFWSVWNAETRRPSARWPNCSFTPFSSSDRFTLLRNYTSAMRLISSSGSTTRSTGRRSAKNRSTLPLKRYLYDCLYYDTLSPYSHLYSCYNECSTLHSWSWNNWNIDCSWPSQQPSWKSS